MTDVPPPLTFVRLPPTSPHFLPAYTLLTDSIAQYRSVLTLSLLYSHPQITIPPTVVVLLFLLRTHDLPMVMILFAGYCIAVLSTCGYLTYGYIERAEWMGSQPGLAATVGGGHRELVGALWGEEGKEEVIGVALFERGEDEDGDEELLVRGWTVRLKYRGKGVGRGLLEKVTEIGGGKVRFADDHVHSYRLPRIPAMFNKVFDRKEVRARALLEDVMKSQ